jgi:hypothetical protein
MIRRRFMVAVLFAIGLFTVRIDSRPQNSPAQTPARSSGAVVLGKVTDGPGGAGVPEASVRLYPRQGGQLSTVWTDALGQFVFFNVADGAYELASSKPGYFAGTYGQQGPQERGRDFVITGARAPVPITIPIWKAGEITGRVMDENGEPMAGWPVQVWAKFARGGRAQFVAQPSRAVTDDRGAYRLGDIYPGDYLLVVKPVVAAIEVNGELRSYVPLIHPAASTVSGGSPLTIAVRDERVGMDFRAKSSVAHRVAGRVTGAATTAGLTVRLTAWDDDADPELEVGLTRTGRNGEFVFPAVPRGIYRMASWNREESASGGVGVFLADDYGGVPEVMSEPRRPPDSFVRVVVSDTDLTSISIALPNMVEIAGRYLYRGATPPQPQVVKSVSAFVSTPGGVLVGFQSPDETGAFRYRVPPGAYFVRPTTAPPGWMVESITVAGRDALDAPIIVGDGGVTDLVISFTDKITEVTGTVHASDGGNLSADREATVLVFPSDPKGWIDFGLTPIRIRNARVTPTGAFTVRGLLPGAYFMIATYSTEAGADWQLATNFARLARAATRVQVVPEGKASVDLKVWSGR